MKTTHILFTLTLAVVFNSLSFAQEESTHWQLSLQGGHGRVWSPNLAAASDIPWSAFISCSRNERWDLTLRAAGDLSRFLSSYHNQFGDVDTIDGMPVIRSSLRTTNHETLRFALIPGFRYRPFARGTGPLQPIIGAELILGWYVQEDIKTTNDVLLTHKDGTNYFRRTIVQELSGNGGGGIGAKGLIGMEWRPWSGLVIASEAGPSIMWSSTNNDFYGTWTNTSLSGPEETPFVYTTDQEDTGSNIFDFQSVLSMSVRIGWEF